MLERTRKGPKTLTELSPAWQRIMAWLLRREAQVISEDLAGNQHQQLRLAQATQGKLFPHSQ